MKSVNEDYLRSLITQRESCLNEMIKLQFNPRADCFTSDVTRKKELQAQINKIDDIFAKTFNF